MKKYVPDFRCSDKIGEVTKKIKHDFFGLEFNFILKEVTTMTEMLKKVAVFGADSSACGSACGAKDPEKAPASACGSACGASDPEKAPASACGSACGAGDPEKK